MEKLTKSISNDYKPGIRQGSWLFPNHSVLKIPVQNDIIKIKNQGERTIMGNDSNKKLSKFLSLVLRHEPGAAGIQLDEHGWADVKELIQGVNGTGRKLDERILKESVLTNDKQRFSFNSDGTKIRANQGHSHNVDVELKETIPPDLLYHGTATRFLGSILNAKEGLRPGSRLYVHLSKDYDTAIKVGTRHGVPVVLKVDARQMRKDGYVFYLSENGVWLVKNVPEKYLTIEKISSN